MRRASFVLVRPTAVVRRSLNTVVGTSFKQASFNKSVSASASKKFFDANLLRQVVAQMVGASVFGLIMIGGTTLYIDAEASEREIKAYRDAMSLRVKAIEKETEDFINTTRWMSIGISAAGIAVAGVAIVIAVLRHN